MNTTKLVPFLIIGMFLPNCYQHTSNEQGRDIAGISEVIGCAPPEVMPFPTEEILWDFETGTLVLTLYQSPEVLNPKARVDHEEDRIYVFFETDDEPTHCAAREAIVRLTFALDLDELSQQPLLTVTTGRDDPDLSNVWFVDRPIRAHWSYEERIASINDASLSPPNILSLSMDIDRPAECGEFIVHTMVGAETSILKPYWRVPLFPDDACHEGPWSTWTTETDIPDFHPRPLLILSRTLNTQEIVIHEVPSE